MAIEALHQLTEDHGLLVPLQGYKVEELTIDSALIVPSEGSAELLFNVGELPTSDRQRRTRFDFRLSSVTEDGKWSEHGRGIMSLVEPVEDVETQDRPIPRTKSSHAQKWYAALSKVGVEFGPTFQTLSDISFPAKNEAMSDLELCTTKDTMTAESSYIIHPTSLDGCLQLSVMAAYGDTKSTTKAFLPVAVEEMTVWARFTSDTMHERAIIHARGTLQGLRSVHGSAEVFDNNGNLFVKGKVSFISLEGGLIDSSSEHPRQPYTSLIWKPDVDRLGALYDVKLNYHRYINPAPQTKSLDLVGYLELLTHKAQIVKVLQFGCDSASHFIGALQGGSKQQLFSQYTVISHDLSSLETTKKSLHGSKNVEFRLLDFERSLQDQNFENSTYDLVILTDVSNVAILIFQTKANKPQTRNTTSIGIEALQTWMTLLKPLGKLVIDASVCELLTRATWSTNLAACGFTYDQQSWSIIIAVKPVLNEVPQTHEPLFLV